MSELSYRVALPEELDDICEFYWSLADTFQDARYSPAWTREIYPAREDLRDLLACGNLWLAERDGRVLGAFAVDQRFNEDYEGTDWPSGAPASEAAVVHLLCVAPGMGGQGLGRQLIERALRVARDMGVRVVRLDVLTGNVPAHRLYESVGFVPVVTKELFYEDTGRVNFTLYELVL